MVSWIRGQKSQAETLPLAELEGRVIFRDFFFLFFANTYLENRWF
jgi:hypothetical protein